MNNYNHTFTPVVGIDSVQSLRDEVAKIAYTAMVQELGTNARGLTGDVVHAVAKTVAKVSFDFADAFMRERYERDSIARSNMQANINHNGWKTTS